MRICGKRAWRDSSPDATMAWPRNLAIRHLTQRDGNRTTAHWTTRRAFVYARHRPKGEADTPLSSHRHPRAMTATARSATRSHPVAGLGRDHLHRSGKHTAAAAQAPLPADAYARHVCALLRCQARSHRLRPLAGMHTNAPITGGARDRAAPPACCRARHRRHVPRRAEAAPHARRRKPSGAGHVHPCSARA